MAINVTQVRQIAKLPAAPIVTDDTVNLFIKAATVVYGSIPTEQSAGWDADKIDMIQLYLAAHFAVLSEEYGGLAQQVVGESEERYQDIASERGIGSTRFGKTAIVLDTSGTLDALTAKPLKALFRVFSEYDDTMLQEIV